MKWAVLVTAACVAAVAVSTGFSLPPSRLELPGTASEQAVTGVVHIHTNRSDGRSSPDEVAAAAAKAGLRFIVFTDHGDGTAAPGPPTYRAGVLCLEGVEISTAGGHYLALDMPAAPYPLGGDPRDVVEDVRRLGGFGVIAHPDSPRHELRWHDWDLPFDGVEIVNPDTSWRTEFARPEWRPKLNLLHALLTYPFRPSETIARQLAENRDTADEFGALAEKRRVVALVGADAHERLVLGSADPIGAEFSLPFPGYEAVFKTLAIVVRTDRAFSGSAAADARLLIDAVRAGRLYSVISGVASPSVFELTAENTAGLGREGDLIPAGGPVTLRVRSNAPSGFTTTIRQGNRALASGDGPELSFVAASGRGVYRADISTNNGMNAVPWIVSNPIYVGVSDNTPDTRPARVTTTEVPLFDGRSMKGWRTETDPSSRAAVDVAELERGPTLRVLYALAGGAAVGQFAAVAVETPSGIASFDRLALTIRADRQMRVSVQARVATSGEADERWERSIYLDEREREVTVDFADMSPVGVTRTPTPALNAVHSIVFVVELTHAKPGASGRLWISAATLRR